MKKFCGVFIFLTVCIAALACVDLEDNGIYFNSTEVCNKVYFLENGMKIHGNNILFDCNSAVIRGRFENSGITIINSNNITIKDCNIMHFNIGINVQNSNRTILERNHLIKNNYGTKFFGSEDSFVYSADVSLKAPVKIAGSKDNFVNYFNKKVKDELCSDSQCNKPLATSKHRNILDYSPKNLFWISPFQSFNFTQIGQWSEP